MGRPERNTSSTLKYMESREAVKRLYSSERETEIFKKNIDNKTWHDII